jgi:methanogenic corrinoid protein MtbC1
VEGLHERGLSMEAIYIELFADTARRLGAQWDDDDITFTHVTTGVWRLQQMLHHFRSAFLAEAPRRDTGLRILLAPAIGSQHSLGTAMVGEFFRRDGWSVHTALVTSNTDLADIVRAEWFDAIGFSLGDTGRLADLRTTIEAGRRASRNLQIGIIVGGPAFAQDASYGGFVGADAVAMDGRDAPRLIEEALNLSARPG